MAITACRPNEADWTAGIGDGNFTCCRVPPLSMQRVMGHACSVVAWYTLSAARSCHGRAPSAMSRALQYLGL